MEHPRNCKLQAASNDKSKDKTKNKTENSLGYSPSLASVGAGPVVVGAMSE